ncbi:hypothetical protein KIN20_030489 [Parelaphostrongylus tenuis]|uniref:Uncharacterized protein n=1 Tax=Parelaphostrongylus tenuis TaxID=148309 RepID=A0AAD5WG58_PARTN|nr:hypothetical protein KIN20_030489 [Parelaphostrongylus tenuis]
MCDEHPQTSIAPHRGFNSKARDILIGGSDSHRINMVNRSASEFDLRRKVVGFRNTESSDSSISPKTPGSTRQHSLPVEFDSIGERPMVQRHKKLEQIGKMMSCCELKHIEKPLITTYEEENIIKMPR